MMSRRIPLSAAAPRHRRQWPVNATVTAVLLAVSAECVVAHAEESATSQVADPEGKQVLPSVKVTARRSAERSKDVPFALSVMQGNELGARRLDNLEEALKTIPGVNVSAWGGANDTNLRIRGVGTLNQISMDDNSVVVNVDGASISPRHASLSLFDIERVEVLKGPQGTLFGRNSQAGAVNVVARKPTRATEGYLRADVGENGQHLEEAAVGGALSERLSGRFAIRGGGSENRVDNVQGNEPVTKPTDLAYRGSLLWDLATGTSALLIAERSQARHKVGLEVLRPYGDNPAVDVTPGIFDKNRKVLERYSVEVNHDLAASRISSVSAATSADFVGVKAQDRNLNQALYGSPMERIARDSSVEHVVSQDLRWSSLPNAPVFWVGGLNLSHSTRSFDTVYYNPDFSAGSTQDRDFKTDNQAVYGEVTYPVAKAVKLTGGLRHSWEKKSYEAQYTGGGATTQDERKLTDRYSTGRLALSYVVDPETNLYGLLARGYKSGGFNDYSTQVADSAPYKPAIADTMEFGIKSESADRRLTLNVAVFFNRVKDDHLLTYDPATFAASAVNADTDSRGVELETQWRFGNGFGVGSSVSYTNAKITTSALGLSNGDVVAGNRVPDVPRWSGNLSASYRRTLPADTGSAPLRLTARTDYRLVGKRAADPQNHFDLSRYGVLDGRIGVASGNAEVSLWASNLLDAQYDLYGSYYTSTVTTGMPGKGRTLGIGLRYDF